MIRRSQENSFPLAKTCYDLTRLKVIYARSISFDLGRLVLLLSLTFSSWCSEDQERDHQ